MFEVFKKKEKTDLDEAIENRIKELKKKKDKTEEDTAEIKNLKDLVDAKEKLEGPKHRINPNTVLSAAASLGGILIIVHHERFDVISSKAIGLINKVKLI